MFLGDDEVFSAHWWYLWDLKPLFASFWIYIRAALEFTFCQFCWGKWPLYRARVSKSWISQGLAARVTIGMKLSNLARIVVLVAGLKNFIFFVFSAIVVVTAALVANKQPNNQFKWPKDDGRYEQTACSGVRVISKNGIEKSLAWSESWHDLLIEFCLGRWRWLKIL